MAMCLSCVHKMFLLNLTCFSMTVMFVYIFVIVCFKPKKSVNFLFENDITILSQFVSFFSAHCMFIYKIQSTLISSNT